ncbi:T9SS type A sorting domain-containing protein [bacterium]|nr:T9SS type A sorting domain-containing protein [bacterium]
MIRKIIAMVVVFFIFLGCSQAIAIVVDGDASDWSVIAATDTDINSAIVRNGEWIWRDTTNDERRNTTYYETGGVTPSCDITEVRITADTNALYFLVKFKDLDLGTTGVSYPFVQVAIDYDKSGGLNLLPISGDENDLAQISDNAGWEYLVYAYQNNVAVLVDDIIPGGSTVGSVNYSQYTSTNSITGPYFMEFSVPFTDPGLGSSTHYLDKTVTFSLVCFFHSAAWTGGASHEVRPFETGFSHIIDCISLIDNPQTTGESDGSSHSGTAGTWEEVGDNIVDTYFDIKFDAVGNVVANSTPTITVPVFEVDDVQNNNEVVVEGRGPVFSWSWVFADADTGDIQKAAQIQIDVDTTTANGNIWTCSPLLTATSVQYTGLDALQTDQTYCWRARVMDNHGTWSDWTDAGTFTTIKQARPFNIAKNNLSIDWNNPFNPAKGDYTKIRYVTEKDERVVIRIYDMSGKLIKTLVDSDKLSDVVYTQIWDGRNEDGKLAASGVYFVNIKAGNFTKTEKIVVIK